MQRIRFTSYYRKWIFSTYNSPSFQNKLRTRKETFKRISIRLSFLSNPLHNYDNYTNYRTFSSVIQHPNEFYGGCREIYIVLKNIGRPNPVYSNYLCDLFERIDGRDAVGASLPSSNTSVFS